MAGLIRRLPPRMRGPAMARAMTTPRTIIGTGAAAAAALAFGLPGLAVGGIAALAYGIFSALTVARPRELVKVVFPDIDLDLSRLDATGQTQMQHSLVARQSYRSSVRDCAAGPLRDRFQDMSERVDDVVEGLYKLVLRAQSLRQYLTRVPARGKEEEVARAHSRLRAMPAGTARDQVAAQIEALEQQLAGRRRIALAYEGAMAKIEATIARVEQMAAQVSEVALLGEEATTAGIPGSVDEVSRLVGELDSVRLALEEVSSGQVAPGPELGPSTGRRRRAAQAEVE